MPRSLLVLSPPDVAMERVGALAARSGGTVGLVNTHLDPSEVRVVGCRVEERRAWGGITVEAFDEPLEVGAAIAQLAGFSDAVVVDRLEDWAARLCRHHAGAPDRIDSELASLHSVLSAGLADILLLSAPPTAGGDAPAVLHRRMLEEFRPKCAEVVDLTPR